ncbi:MAG: hypothetical protein KC535_02395 [Nanoarchaeota archaeon]|nr:hypothetical protein [Nanoarchaeota archaeon]
MTSSPSRLLRIFSSKGQAAIEFLTTYGWMFLVVLAVIGALSYFGFTDIKDKVPTSCRFDKSFDCKAFHATEGGSYAVEIKNIDSKQINLTHFICGFPQTDELVRYNYTDIAFEPGESRVYYCSAGPLSTSIVLNGKDLFEMKAVYTYIEAEPLPIVAGGELIAEASDDTDLLAKYQASAQVPTATSVIIP